MLDSMEWLRIFIQDHRSLEYIIIFGWALVGGELALFTLGFFVAQGILEISPVIILSFLATFPPNILWFYLGKTTTADKILSHRYANNTVSVLAEAVARVSQGNHFIALIIIKFLIGTPVILILYVHRTGLQFKEFLIYQTPAVILSLLVILPIGFLSGFGFLYLADVFNNIYASLGFLILVLILMTMVQLWFKKIFTGNQS